MNNTEIMWELCCGASHRGTGMSLWDVISGHETHSDGVVIRALCRKAPGPSSTLLAVSACCGMLPSE